MSIFDRLQYSVDSSIFGSALQWSANVTAYMNNSPGMMSTWQMNDIGNNAASGYFQNPMSANLINMQTYTGNIINIANTTYFANITTNQANSILSTAQSLYNEITNFKSHTDRISGVTKSANTAQYPDFNSAIGVGSQMVILTNQSDKVQNNAPILANFSSLFITSNVGYSNTSISIDSTTLSNSLTANTPANANNIIYTYNSNITSSMANTIISDLNSTYNMLVTYRTNDVNFYLNSLNVLRDFQTVTQFNNLGDVSNFLVQNYIGTPKLIQNLANK